jgi:hypothetical protein
MKGKLIGILVCTLLIASVIPMSTSLAEINEYKKPTLDRGWFYMESYPNYSPSGMPDFDQEQEQWKGIIDGGNGIADSAAAGDDVQIVAEGSPVNPNSPAIIAPGFDCALETTPGGDDIEVWMFSSAVSTMNCFWWFDSRYANPSGTPGDGEDIYPLVADYGAGDDHAATNAPLAIEKMANMLNITSTFYLENTVWEDTINEWFINTSLDGILDFNFYNYPTFDFIIGEMELGKAVILVINLINDSTGDCLIEGFNYVTCAGVHVDKSKIAICDPSLDNENPSEDDHNDAQYVSHDIYNVNIGSPCENLSEVECWLPNYGADYNYSVVCSAMVIEYINNPPETPTIDGPTNGEIKIPYNYTFNAVDPDGDDIFYHITWGDGHVEIWKGPFASGEDIVFEHAYSMEGTYTIEAKVKDIFEVESGLETLEVTMPRNKEFNFNINLFYRLFHRFPNTFPMLRQILGLN